MRFLENLFPSVCWVSLLFWACASDSSWENPDDILTSIHEKGALQTVAQMTQGKRAAWEAMLIHIENGDAQWLDVARELRAGTDAVTTIELRFAVARALPISPQEVLNLIDRGFQVEEICVIPFVEADRAVEVDYLKRTKEALMRVRATKNDAARLHCLGFVEQYLALYQSNKL